MTAYSIQRDPPWMQARESGALSPDSMYSEDGDATGPQSIPPSGVRRESACDPSYHAHPKQQIKDFGPQVRQSRLPIFKRVRSMLHRPPPITTKWDQHTGELSESGKPSTVQPSTYISTYDGASKTSKKPSAERLRKNRRDRSPVSVLRDDEITQTEQANENARPRSSISPISPDSPADDQYEDALDRSLLPEPLSPNVQRTLRTVEQTTPSPRVIKRKPVSGSFSSPENQPPAAAQHSPSQSSDISPSMDENKDANNQRNPKSHFSWTTYAPTVATGRHSIDAITARDVIETTGQPSSRFSWSTAATGAAPLDSPPSSPPRIPPQYSMAPVQSILSRRRPVQRIEKPEWAPPAPRARSGDAPSSATPKDSPTPTSASTVRGPQFVKASTPTSRSPSTAKALPPPPQLSSANNLTHLETLLAQERDIVLQRSNVERGIREMEKVVKASPLEVPFSTVRDAKRRLAKYRTRLAEVRLEEQEIGVAIARTRRREEKATGGDGETLWVRRFGS